MTYGDFAWNHLLGKERRKDRISDRPRAVFVEGEPEPWMEAGEDAWAWQVQRALPHPLNRPYFTFTISEGTLRRHALDDFIQPVITQMKNEPVSLWAKLQEGARPGLRIADTPPAFPPKFERTLLISCPEGQLDADAVSSMVEKQAVISGSAPIGVHIALSKLYRSDFDFGGNVRVVFDGLSTLLGGDLARPADRRIRDLRVVRDTQTPGVTEVRLWQIPDEPL